MTLAARCTRSILLMALAIGLSGAPAATAQAPATNASGGQYLPAVPGGAGNREEGDLMRAPEHRGRTGLKAVGSGEDSSAGGRLSPALPLAMALSLLAAGGFLLWPRVRTHEM